MPDTSDWVQDDEGEWHDPDDWWGDQTIDQARARENAAIEGCLNPEPFSDGGGYSGDDPDPPYLAGIGDRVRRRADDLHWPVLEQWGWPLQLVQLPPRPAVGVVVGERWDAGYVRVNWNPFLGELNGAIWHEPCDGLIPADETPLYAPARWYDDEDYA